MIQWFFDFTCIKMNYLLKYKWQSSEIRCLFCNLIIHGIISNDHRACNPYLLWGGGSCNFQPSIRGGSVNFEPRRRGGSLVLQPLISQMLRLTPLAPYILTSPWVPLPQADIQRKTYITYWSTKQLQNTVKWYWLFSAVLFRLSWDSFRIVHLCVNFQT